MRTGTLRPQVGKEVIVHDQAGIVVKRWPIGKRIYYEVLLIGGRMVTVLGSDIRYPPKGEA